MASKPEIGKEYIIQSGDRLETISARAYGDPKYWKVLWYALQKDKRNKSPDKIFPGQKIIIPELSKIEETFARAVITPANTEPVGVPDKTFVPRIKERLPFIIEIGKETSEGIMLAVPYNGRFFAGADVAARTWTGSFAWDMKNSSYFDAGAKKRIKSDFFNMRMRSGSFAQSRCYIDGECVGTGFLLERSYSISSDSGKVDCVFYSNTKHMIDSELLPDQQMQAEITNGKQTLKDIAAIIAANYRSNYINPRSFQGRWETQGIVIKYDKDLDPATGEEFKFQFAAARPGTEKVIAFLQRLAAQRGIFIADDELGDLVLHKIPNCGEISAYIDYSSRITNNITAKYDDSYLFASYIGYTQSDGNGTGSRKQTECQIKVKKEYLGIPKCRIKVFEAPDLTGSIISDAATWLIQKAYLDSHSFSIPVYSLRNQLGELWRPATLINFKSPVLEDDKWHLMVIRSVEYNFAPEEQRVNLTVCPAFVVKNGSLEVLEGTEYS